MPTPVSFKLNIKADLKDAQKTLNQVHQLLSSPDEQKTLMSQLGTILENSTRARFESKTDPEGKTWANWAASTKRQKKYQKRQESERLLRDTSLLLRSLTKKATSKQVIVGSRMKYAPFLQQGTKHMPARPFFGISTSDKEDIRDQLQLWLKRIWEKK